MSDTAATEQTPPPPPGGAAPDQVGDDLHPSPPPYLADPPPPAAAGDRREIFRALEVVERDSAAIAESFASLFSSLRLALSEVTTTSMENIQCFSDVVGNLQESALDAATKGNRYINSCLRLNAEMKGMESLAMQFQLNNLLRKLLKRNVDALDLAVSRLVRLP